MVFPLRAPNQYPNRATCSCPHCLGTIISSALYTHCSGHPSVLSVIIMHHPPIRNTQTRTLNQSPIHNQTPNTPVTHQVRYTNRCRHRVRYNKHVSAALIDPENRKRHNSQYRLLSPKRTGTVDFFRDSLERQIFFSLPFHEILKILYF